MSKKIEKTYEEKLHSLKIGCIVFGVIKILSLISTIISLINGKGIVILLLLEIAMIALLYFMYKFTKEKNPIGPILEYIFGGLMCIEGIIYCFSVVGIFIGIIFIIFSIGIISEAKYFKNHLA